MKLRFICMNLHPLLNESNGNLVSGCTFHPLWLCLIATLVSKSFVLPVSNVIWMLAALLTIIAQKEKIVPDQQHVFVSVLCP